MLISVIVPTMRVGGIDVLIDSLAKQTYTNFELVLVDAITRRKDEVIEYARDKFVACRYVAIEPNPFPVCSFCLQSNAGIEAATGEVLLFAVDYSRFPPDLLAKHAAFHKADKTRRAGFMGPHRYVGLDIDKTFPRFGQSQIDAHQRAIESGQLDPFMLSIGRALDTPAQPHSADGGATVPHDADPKLRMPAGPIGAEFFHAKNESIRRSVALEVGGYDQDLDGAHLYQDSDFADRLSTKAGVKWTLDPTAVIEIANPRHVFPFAKRTREHQENFQIWQDKKRAGYPGRPKNTITRAPVVTVDDDPSVGRVSQTTSRKLRVAMVYGEFSSYGHGPYTADGIYKSIGLTGSEGSFFNLARTLSERGHEVAVFCETTTEQEHPAGFAMLPLPLLAKFPEVRGVDAVLAWNEPDYLKFAPAGALRVCDQQLNDFGYAGGGWYQQAGRFIGPHVSQDWHKLVDVWVSPSANHRRSVMAPELALKDGDFCPVLPNSVDLDLFAGDAPKRYRHRAVYCSSPDRGLHHVLSLWPAVRAQVPDAELHVFYSLTPWLARAREAPDQIGTRARYIENALARLQGHGVVLRDSVPNVQMARELQAAACLVYPCDPVRYTEGFGCSVLDAAAAGCIPIISNADALPEVHGDAAVGLNTLERDDWVKAVVSVMTGNVSADAQERMQRHAKAHSRQAIADKWERILSEAIDARRGAYAQQDCSRPDVQLR
jgi:glycosyltransferase involved in cell wall biosynthesis